MDQTEWRRAVFRRSSRKNRYKMSPEIANFVWMMTAAALILLMQAVFWLVGFGLMFGATKAGWIGTSMFVFGQGVSPWLLAFFLFQLVFCGTASGE